jgi:hypothetical protein
MYIVINPRVEELNNDSRLFNSPKYKVTLDSKVFFDLASAQKAKMSDGIVINTEEHFSLNNDVQTFNPMEDVHVLGLLKNHQYIKAALLFHKKCKVRKSMIDAQNRMLEMMNGSDETEELNGVLEEHVELKPSEFKLEDGSVIDLNEERNLSAPDQSHIPLGVEDDSVEKIDKTMYVDAFRSFMNAWERMWALAENSGEHLLDLSESSALWNTSRKLMNGFSTTFFGADLDLIYQLKDDYETMGTFFDAMWECRFNPNAYACQPAPEENRTSTEVTLEDLKSDLNRILDEYASIGDAAENRVGKDLERKNELIREFGNKFPHATFPFVYEAYCSDMDFETLWLEFESSLTSHLF